MMDIQHVRPDGTFVVIRNGHPYHVERHDPMFAAVAAQADGVDYPPEPMPEAPPVTVATYQQSIEARIEATAAQRGYSSGTKLAGYVTSTIPGWAAEAAAFVAWRDQVWLAAHAGLAAFHAGDEPPSVEAFLATLHPIAWPS